MKISIITPTLNGSRYLAECIESVLGQDYQDAEQIIVDGLSVDNTLEIASQYQCKYFGRMKVHCAQDNGAGDAFNWGVAHAAGEVLGWLGADDKLLPGTLAKVATFFSSHPDVHFVYGETEIIDTSGKFVAMYATREHTYRRLLNSTVYIVPTSAFYRKQVFDKCGLLPSFGSDYEAWLRIGKYFPFHYLKGEHLSQFRIHGKNSSTKMAQKTIAYNYQASRRYGGHLFNEWWFVYYATKIVNISEPLKPLLGWSYPVLNPIAQKLIKVFCYHYPLRSDKKED